MEKKKRTAWGIASNALIAVLAAAFVWLLFQDGPSIRGTEEQPRGQNNHPPAAVEAIIKADEVYRACENKTLETMPGIVCWGDEAAVGNTDGSLPGKLYKLLISALFADLEEAFARQLNYFHLNHLLIPVVNMGVAREGMDEILTRCGASPLLLAADYTLPLYGTMKNIPFMNGMGNELHFAEQKYAKFNKVHIQGVSGYLYASMGGYDRDHPYLAFAREFQGRSLTAPRGTPVETEGATAYRQYLPVLYFQSTLGQTEDAFVQSLTMMLNRHENTSGYYAVIVCAEDHSSLDEALTAAFGARYIRAEKTAKDMLDTDYAALAQTVFDCLDGQGAFGVVRDAVREALEQIENINENGGAA